MNLLNKTTRILLMIILCLCLFSVTSKASIKGKVIADNIRLRSEANTESKIITLVSVNEEVEVIEKEGTWYKIEYKGKTGYLKSEFIKLQDEATTVENKETTPAKVDNQESITETTVTEQEVVLGVKTVAGTEKIYILPLLNSKVVETVEANKELEVLQSVNGWSYVISDLVSGWIRTDKLVENKEEQVQQSEDVEEENQEKEEQVSEKEINRKGYIKSKSVNFRKEPSKSAQVLDSLTINMEVTVLTQQDDWYKIKVNNKTGYVAKELISFEKVELPSSRSEDQPRKNTTTQTSTIQEQNTVPTDNTTSDLGQKIANYAQGFVEYPYVYGGSTPSGFDCSGFTSYVYKQFGYSISRSSSAQASNGVAVAKADLQPGDLVLFKGQNSSSIGHVGIYIGGNQFVHASTAKTGVKISSLSSSGYVARYVTARRII